MIKLFSKSKQPDSVLPVRWCIPKSSLEKLKEGNIVNPHVLLMITRKGFDDSVVQIDRRIAHMDQAMEYISFARAGVYKIYAALIYPIHGEEVADAKRFRRKFLEIHNGHYYRYVLDSSGDYYKD